MAERTITTSPEKPTVSFGVLADCQYTDEADEAYDIPANIPLRYVCEYRKSPDKLEEAIDFLNTQDLDFIVHLGDFIDRRADEIAPLTALTDTSKAPFWHVLGNHEYKDPTSRIEHVLAQYAMPERYYSRVIENYRFVIVDSSEEGLIAHPEGTPEWQRGANLIENLKQSGAVNAYPWNGGIGEKQLQWLQDQLAQAERDQQRVVIFSHHPVFPPGPLNMLNDKEIVSLNENSPGVSLFMNGHNHLGGFGEKSNIPYITMSGVVEGPTNAFGIVNLYESGSGSLKGYGRQVSHTWDPRYHVTK